MKMAFGFQNIFRVDLTINSQLGDNNLTPDHLDKLMHTNKLQTT